MYCHKCGSPLQPAASFCHNCGAAVAQEQGQGAFGNTRQVPLPEASVKRRAREIWNPNAAANWSLLFTPAFGAYIHYLNWQKMGKTEQAQTSLYWFYVSCAMLATYPFLGFFIADADKADAAARGLGLLLLLAWYFANGRAQGKYVKERAGTDYPKRSWGKPLLIALGITVAYFFVVFGVAVAVAS